MFKRVMLVILSASMMFNLCGCFALFVGAAGGAGTAAWLSGKLTQELHASYHATVDASIQALKELNLQIVKETQAENVTQIKGLYTDGRDMWIDVHRVTDVSTRVEVRVGAVTSDKEAASVVLTKIQSLL